MLEKLYNNWWFAKLIVYKYIKSEKNQNYHRDPLHLKDLITEHSTNLIILGSCWMQRMSETAWDLSRMFWVQDDCSVHPWKVILLLCPSVFQVDYTSVLVLSRLLFGKNVLFFLSDSVFNFFFFRHQSVGVWLVRNGVLRVNFMCLG